MKTARILLGFLLLVCTSFAAHADCTSAVTNLAQPQQFPNRVAASVAWSSSVIGAAKNESDTTNTNAIYFAAYDAAFNPVTLDRLVVPTSLAGAIALVWNGTEFGLFYQNGAYQLFLQRLTVTGTAIGAPIAVAPNHLPWAGQEFDIAWDAGRNGYDIVRTMSTGFEKGLWLTIIGTDGTIKYDQQISFYVSSPATPRIALANGGKIGILWLKADSPNDVLSLLVINSQNTAVGAATISNVGRSGTIASNGTQFLVVDTAPVSTGSEIRAALYDTNAAQLQRELPFIAATGIDVAPVSVIWNPVLSEYSLLYLDSISGFVQFPGQLRLHRFASLSSQASDTLFSPEITFDTLQPRGALIAAGSAYVSAASRFFSKQDGSSSYLIKLCALSTAAQVSQKYAALFVPVTFTAPTTGGVPGYSFVWNFGDLTPELTGATVSHYFGHVGTYTVTVTARDSAGAVSSATTQVIVTIERRRGAKK